MPPPIGEGHPYSAADPHNDTLLLKYTIPLIDSIAKTNDLFVADFHTPFVDSAQYFTDHLHPNIEGHKKMAKILFNRFIEEGIIDNLTSTTPILDHKIERKALVFPNPSNQTCTIQIPDEISGAVDIHIFNDSGSTILSLKNVKEKLYSLDVSSLIGGMYYISINSENKILTDKIIVI